jgi:hypothetical protein
MNRTRTGRGAPPWPPRNPIPNDLEISEYMPASDTINRFKPAPTPVHTEVHAEAAPPVERAVAHRESHLPQRQGTALAVPHTTKHPGVSTPEAVPTDGPTVSETGADNAPHEADLLADLPAFKAAMESLEKQGISILESEPAKSTRKERAKAKPAKRKRKRKPLAAHATVRPTAPRKRRRPRTQASIDLSRHRRRCGVCHDPELEAIEEAFIQWRNVDAIDSEFEPEGGRSAIYRHAHAFNLFKKRSLNLRSALEYIIEESERIMPTAEGIVKAMRAYTRINDVGEWIDPPTKHIVQVIAMPSMDTRNADNPIPGLALDVRKDRSQIIYPEVGRVESGIRQPLLTETAQQSEKVATD